MKMINIAEILKDCPKGTKLYSSVYGDVEFTCVLELKVINVTFTDPVTRNSELGFFNRYGQMYTVGECVLFPSKNQRDWTKFKAKKERFDPHTLKPFDRVVVRLDTSDTWTIDFFSHLTEDNGEIIPIVTGNVDDFLCIPFNEETAHLVGTTDDCPEYYKWWEEDNK